MGLHMADIGKLRNRPDSEPAYLYHIVDVLLPNMLAILKCNLVAERAIFKHALERVLKI